MPGRKARTVVVAVLAAALFLPVAHAQEKPLPGLPSDKAADLYKQGERLLKKGKHAMAVKSFDAAAKAAPLFHLAHYASGNVLAQLGQRREAMKRYERAVAAKPDFAAGWNAIGVLQIDDGEYAAAVKSFDTALRADEDHHFARIHKAQALLRLQRPAEAESELRTLLAKKPGMADAQVDLAAARSMQGDPKGAMATVDALLKKHPKNGRGLLLRAQLLENEGKLFEAADALGTVLERAGKDKGFRLQAGRSADRVAKKAHKRRDLRAHVRALETLVLVIPKDAKTRARFGAALIELYESHPEDTRDDRLRQRAVRELEASLEIDPDQAAVKRVLERYR
jgi:tetratricopeptide (TPR) repeat protein